MRQILVDVHLLTKKFQLEQLKTYFQRGNLKMIGPTITYYTLLSLVPILMSVGAVASLVGIDANELVTLLSQHLPSNIMTILEPIIESVLKGGIGILSFSILTTLWAASSVLAIIRKSFNTIYDVPERVSGLFTRVFSFLWLLVILVSAGLIMIVSAVLPAIIAAIPGIQWLEIITQQRWLITLIGLWLIICALNETMPAKRVPFKPLIIGSGIEVVLIIFVNYFFGWYAQFTVKNAGFYQSLGSLLVLIVYLNLICTMLVVGQIVIAWLDGLFLTTLNPVDEVPKDAKRISAKQSSVNPGKKIMHRHQRRR
jgi:membrane protein